MSELQPVIADKANSVITLASHQPLGMLGHHGEEFDIVNGVTIVGWGSTLTAISKFNDQENSPCVVELYGVRPTPRRMDLKGRFTFKGQLQALVTHGPILSVNYQGEAAQAAARLEVPEDQVSESDISKFTMVFPLGSHLSRLFSATTQDVHEVLNMHNRLAMSFFREGETAVTPRDLGLINSSLDHLQRALKQGQ